MLDVCPMCGHGKKYVPTHVATMDEINRQVFATRPAPERHNELREALRYKTLQEVKASPDDECLAFYNADHSVKGYLSRHQIEQAADDITQREPQ